MSFVYLKEEENSASLATVAWGQCICEIGGRVRGRVRGNGIVEDLLIHFRVMMLKSPFHARCAYSVVYRDIY